MDGTLKRIGVWLDVGWKRVRDFNSGWRDISFGKPTAKIEHGDHVELIALPWHCLPVAIEIEIYPMTAVVLAHYYRRRIGQDVDEAGQALQAFQQAVGRHHGVCNHIEHGWHGSARGGQADCRIVRRDCGACPQRAQSARRITSIGIVQCGDIHMGILEQCGHVQASGRKHVRHALYPGR